MRRALSAPLLQIVENAGVEGAVILHKVQESKGDIGFNAATEELEDLTKAGVIDPTKVVRTALQNAASVAGLLLTTEGAVVEKTESSGGMAGAPDMGDMDF